MNPMPQPESSSESRPRLLRAVDVAAFVTALVARLRTAGVPVDMTGAEAFARGLRVPDGAGFPHGTGHGSPRSRLYWIARVTLIRNKDDLAAFDAVFAAVFDESASAEGHTHGGPGSRAETPDDAYVPVRRPAGPRDAPVEDAALPWAALPAVSGGAAGGRTELTVRGPSGLDTASGAAFAEFDDAQLDQLVAALVPARWPARRSRRRRTSPRGSRVALRATLARARRTGLEPAELVRDGPVLRRRPVVLLCDVSQSMQPYARLYLHFMRALAVTTECEVFAFATSLTRLTPAMKLRSARAAVAEATDEVGDRFGGTRIATNVSALLRSVHGATVRGGVVIIASDGWDHDEPAELDAAMAALRRRAHTVVWMNPRASARGYAPLVGSMQAALPYCDHFLPASDLGGLAGVLGAVADRG